jgi:hypothetical protein
MGRKINDGDRTGMKMDRFRHSRFEYEDEPELQEQSERRTSNTISGPYSENRGRRSSEGTSSAWENSPFEDGQVSSWNKRQGWDQYYNRGYERGFRRHGGAQIGHDLGHQGRGPKGYKRSDESIYDDVCDLLARSPDVDAREVEVKVTDGVAYLNGSVSNRQMKKMAELEIENVSGLRDVQNLLSIVSKNKDLH